MKLATAKQMQELDRAAIEGRGIPSTLLMERAAAAVADAAQELAASGRRTVLFCGTGNNGGDGVCAALLLKKRGFSVRAFLVGAREGQSGDNREMERRFGELGGVLEDFDPGSSDMADACREADVLVDALFGVGLHRPLGGDALIAAHLMNASPAPVVAADIASGVEADTGRVLGVAVHAKITVTFTLAKPGHFAGEGALRCGALRVADIGIPRDLIHALNSETFAVTKEDVDAWLPRRRRDAHKGDFGRVAIASGSAGYTGAPVFASRAAVRTGSGLVHLLVPDSIYTIAAVKSDEAMPSALPSDPKGRFSAQAADTVLDYFGRCDAALLGPGLGRSAALTALTEQLISESPCPLILDADGINAVSDDIYMLRGARVPPVLTPHDGEFRRLGGDLSHSDRLTAARDFASMHNCILVLKGHRTITAFPDGRSYINTTGNPGMAKGGSGDVLAGMILSLLGQGLPPARAVPAAVWLHGHAGDLCAEKLGEYSMTPSDLIEALPEVLRAY